MPASSSWCATAFAAPTIRSSSTRSRSSISVLKIDTPYGPCWRRYNHDGYGQRKDGGPFIGWGQGRAWPILTGERAHYELAAGHDVGLLSRRLEQFSSFGGMLPEQVWDYADLPSEGMYFGRSAGSAQPLVWVQTRALCCRGGPRDLPLTASHNRAVLSWPPVSTRLPSGLTDEVSMTTHSLYCEPYGPSAR